MNTFPKFNTSELIQLFEQKGFRIAAEYSGYIVMQSLTDPKLQINIPRTQACPPQKLLALLDKIGMRKSEIVELLKNIN